MKKVITSTIEQTHALAADFFAQITGNIVALEGDLGSGKTTFVQGILKACSAEGPYTSPTFTIMKEYDVDADGFRKIYHIDAYRIGENDMIELGWHDIITDGHALVIVEWPENISGILPLEVNKIQCAWVSVSERAYTFI